MQTVYFYAIFYLVASITLVGRSVEVHSFLPIMMGMKS